MNNFAIGVIVVLIGTVVVSVSLGLKFSQATLVWGFIAASCAPIIVHRVPDRNWAIGLLCGAAILASFPLKELLQLNNLFSELLVTVVYGGVLFVAGVGWKRDWTEPPAK